VTVPSLHATLSLLTHVVHAFQKLAESPEDVTTETEETDTDETTTATVETEISVEEIIGMTGIERGVHTILVMIETVETTEIVITTLATLLLAIHPRIERENSAEAQEPTRLVVEDHRNVDIQHTDPNHDAAGPQTRAPLTEEEADLLPGIERAPHLGKRQIRMTSSNHPPAQLTDAGPLLITCKQLASQSPFFYPIFLSSQPPTNQPQRKG